MKRKNVFQKLAAVCAGLIAIVCGTFAVTGVFADQESGGAQTPPEAGATGLHYSDMFKTNEYASLNDHVTYKDQTGLQVVMHSKAAEIQYQGVVDLRDNDESAPLFELIFSPQVKGEGEISNLTFTFTDCIDPSNYLVFTIYGLTGQYPDVCMVSAYGNGQQNYRATWVSYPSSIVGSTDYPLAIYFDATTLATKAWPTKWGNNENRNSLDAIRDLDAGSGAGWLYAGEAPWEGLKSGLYNLKITASGVSNTSASFVLLGLDGLTFNAEEATAADERLSIAIDYDSYDKDALPYGVVGLGYPVREATAISNFSGEFCKIAPIVVDENGNVVPVTNGKFYPTAAGTYYALYGLTSELDNVAARRYRVQVKEAYDQEVTYTSNEKLLTEACVGDTVFLYEGTASGGSGRLRVENALLFNGNTITPKNEGYFDFFVPETAGTYVLATKVTDSLGTSKTFEHEITVTERTENLRVGFVPKVAMKGYPFTLPKGFYDGANGAQSVIVKLNGEDYTAETFVPQSTFTLSYAYGGEEKNYTVHVQDGAYAEGFMKNYFYAENGSVGFDQDGKMLLTASAGDATFSFARAIYRELLGFSWNLIESADGFDSIDFCLQDGKDAGLSVTLSIVREVQADETVKYFAVTNGGTEKLEIAGNMFANIYAVSFDYGKSAFVASDGTVLGTVRFYDNMRKYTGLNEDVYVFVKMRGVEESAQFKLVSISNQQLLNDEEDFTLPQFIWKKEFVSLMQLQLNDTYTTEQVFGYDVLGVGCTSSVQIRYGGKTVYEGDGTEPYALQLNNYGSYTVTYFLFDTNNNVLSARVTIAVIDNVAPSISLTGKYDTSVEVGSEVNLARTDVSDNVSESGKIKVYYIVRNLKTGKEVAVSGNVYVASQKGQYTVRVLAIDETGNVASTEYALEVK